VRPADRRSILAVPKRTRRQSRREVIPEPFRKLVDDLLKFFRANTDYKIEDLPPADDVTESQQEAA